MNQFYEILMLFGLCLGVPLVSYLIFITVKEPIPQRSLSIAIIGGSQINDIPTNAPNPSCEGLIWKF